MKLIRSLMLMLLCFPAILFAQKDNVVFSKDFNVTTSEPYQVIDGSDKDYFYDHAGHSIAVKTDHETVYVQRFDTKMMKEVGRKEYDDLPKGAQPQDLIYIGGKLYYIYLVIDTRGDDTNTLYAREIDINSGIMKNPVILFKSKGPTMKSESIDKKSLFSGGGLRILSYMSTDSSKILFNYRREPLEKKDSKNYDILGFFVFDSGLKKVWGDEVKMPYTEKDMNNLAYCVSKDGDAHMLLYKNDTKTYELLNIKNVKELKTNKIDIDSKLVFQKFNIREDISGNLNCSGFYANGLEFKMVGMSGGRLSMNVNGIKNFTMDMTGKILSTHDYEFPIELINQNTSLKNQEKNEKRDEKGKLGINDLVMRNVIINEDGSTYFVGEQFWIQQATSMTGASSSSIDYIYRDVVITKIDKDGKLLWMKKMDKNQTSEKVNNSLGFRFIHNDNFDYVLFLDNKKNFDKDKDHEGKAYIDGRDAYLNAYKIDAKTGESNKNILFDLDDIQGKAAYQFKVSRLFDVGKSNFMLEVYMKSKKDMMVKMELK